MRGTTRGSIAVALVLLIAGCGTTPKAANPQPGGPAKPSTTTTVAAPTSQAGGPATPSTTGITLAFVAARSCNHIVPVTGGFVGSCIIGYGAGRDPHSGAFLIRGDGAVTPFPGPTAFGQPWFADSAGNLVAQGTVNPPASALLVIQPTSGAVKKAIPLPSPTPRLIGVTGTTAVLASSQNSGDGKVMAYDLAGTKKWDLQFPDFVKPLEAEITPAGVLVFEEGGDRTTSPATHATMRRLDDGSALWDGSGNGLSLTPARVGRTVLYDNAGIPRSLATGEPTGPGPGPSTSPSTGVAYQDDLILTDPLRRVTPQGVTVWTLQGTSGTPGTDGKTLVVLGTNDLVALDPATGRRLGQAPDPSPNVPSCGLNFLLVASPRVILAHPCNEAGTAVYTVNT